MTFHYISFLFFSRQRQPQRKAKGSVLKHGFTVKHLKNATVSCSDATGGLQVL